MVSITAQGTEETISFFNNIMRRGEELRKEHQMKLPAIRAELDNQYDGGWIYTENNAYYFDRSTDMVAFISMVLKDIETS